MKRIISLALVTVLCLSFLCACGGDSIVGTWEAEMDGVTMTYTFEDGGKGKLSAEGISLDMEWSVSGDKLTWEVMGEKEEQPYKLDGDKLIIGEGDEQVTFTKK